MNYSKNITIDTTGQLIVEFDANELDAVILTADEDIYIGFSDITQAVFPVLANSAFGLSHIDFRNQSLENLVNYIRNLLFRSGSQVPLQAKIIRLYAKSQTVASAVVSLHFLGGNR